MGAQLGHRISAVLSGQMLLGSGPRIEFALLDSVRSALAVPAGRVLRGMKLQVIGYFFGFSDLERLLQRASVVDPGIALARVQERLRGVGVGARMRCAYVLLARNGVEVVLQLQLEVMLMVLRGTQ